MDTPELARWWDLAAVVRHQAEILMYGLFLFAFLSAFYPRPCRTSFKAAAVFTGILLFCYWVAFEIDVHVAYGLAIAGSFFILYYHDQSRLTIALFLCAVFLAVRGIVATIGSGVYINWCAQLVWPLSASPVPQLRMFIGACIAEVASESIVMYGALRIIARTFPDRYRSLSWQELGLVVVPAAVAIVCVIVLHRIRQILDYGTYSVDIETMALVLMSTVLISILATVFMFSQNRAAQRRQMEKEILETQLQGMRQYVRRLEQSDARMASLRHDAAAHLETIQILTQRGELSAAQSYAERTYASLSSPPVSIRTGNPVTDAILNEQHEQAGRLGVRYDADFHYPIGLGFDAFDLGVILHNAGNNALENAAGTEHPTVSVQSRLHNRSFLLEFVNDRANTIVANPATGLPQSSKTGHHGFGLLNIQSVAKKYGGTVQIASPPGTFQLTVLLPAPQTDS